MGEALDGRLNRIRGAAALLGFIALALTLGCVQWLFLKTSPRLALWFPTVFHRILCAFLGFRVKVYGRPETRRPLLFVSNHTSWIDIPILGSLIETSFIAKSEVGGWPFFGWLSRLQRTLYVERNRRQKTGDQLDEMRGRFLGGDSLVLFAEGTSNDGNRVLPFRSALLGAAEIDVPHPGRPDGPVDVQPISICYTRLAGVPMGRQFRPFFAWYGDMDLAPHLFQAFMLGPIEVSLAFHKPVNIAEFGSRKQMAAKVHQIVADGVSAMLAGRPEAIQTVEKAPHIA